MRPDVRFWMKVDRDGACWLWNSVIKENGYGQFWVEGRYVQAHRFAYELARGPIPAGLSIDHLCRERACVNPSHLEPVTTRENLRRSPHTVNSINAAKTTCPRGHAYNRKRRQRYCLTCENERRRDAHMS